MVSLKGKFSLALFQAIQIVFSTKLLSYKVIKLYSGKDHANMLFLLLSSATFDDFSDATCDRLSFEEEVKKHFNENVSISNLELSNALEVRQVPVIPKLYINFQT